jgi:hypothetical protein
LVLNGDWGLGIGPNPQSPIPNPQSPKMKKGEFMKKLNNFLKKFSFKKKF